MKYGIIITVFAFPFIVSCGAADCAVPNGTYTATYSERAGGGCGPLPTKSITMVNGVTSYPDGECVVIAANRSADECQRNSTTDCVIENTKVAIVGTTTSNHDDGRTYQGTALLRVTDAADQFICTSVYDVSWVRQ